jgi:hypothetical protein
MKAIQKNGSIKIYKVLPETWDGASGHIINFRQASQAMTLQSKKKVVCILTKQIKYLHMM